MNHINLLFFFGYTNYILVDLRHLYVSKEEAIFY